MKILYATNLFPKPKDPYAGMFVFHRAKKLLEKGVKLSVFSFNNVFKKFPFSFERDYNLKELGYSCDLQVKVINGVYFPTKKICWRIDKALRNMYVAEKFDLVHCHFAVEGYPVYLANEKFSIPYIVTAYGSDVHTFPFINDSYRDLVLSVLNKAGKAVFLSNFLLEKAKEIGYVKQEHEIISSGVDLTNFAPQNEDHRKLRAKGEKVFGFVSRLVFVKRADRFPHICYEIYRNCPNAKFLIVGAGDLRKQLESKFREYGIAGKVTFTGSVSQENVAACMRDMDALLLPSRREGLGSVILEALACGVQVAGTDTGGIPEALGDCGVTVEEGEDFEKRFARAALNLVDNPVPEEKLLSRAQGFTWDRIAEKEMSLYEELCKDRQPG